MSPELLFFVVVGAFTGGFVNGFAGFGTALVVSGLWFSTLPVPLVPPLIILTAMAGQIVGLIRLRRTLSFAAARTLIFTGALGVPLGTWLVLVIPSLGLKLLIGCFLIGYTVYQLAAKPSLPNLDRTAKWADPLVGFLGGVLGGIAGLSGALPVVWFQLRQLSASAQRARYQPYNLMILILAAISMAVFGQITRQVLLLFAVALPLTIAGASLGLRLYRSSSEKQFKQAVLVLLFLSGLLMITQLLNA